MLPVTLFALRPAAETMPTVGARERPLGTATLGAQVEGRPQLITSYTMC